MGARTDLCTVWKAVELGSDYRGEFHAAIESIYARGDSHGVDYSSHWPLEMLGRSVRVPKSRVLVVGKATNGFAQLHPRSAAASTNFARRAGEGFNPAPGGTYNGGFWNFLIGRKGVFGGQDAHELSLVWSNLYKVGRGYNHVTAGRPPWAIDADTLAQRSYTPRNPAPDGGVDNNPTAAERGAQGRARMLRMLRHEIEVCSPDLVLCVCRPWLAEATRGTDWASNLPTEIRGAPCFDADFLGTGVPAVVGRHPIRIPGGPAAYASAVREMLDHHGISHFRSRSADAA